MSEMEIFDPDELVSLNDGDTGDTGVKRIIADAIRRASNRSTVVESMGKRMTYGSYLGVMLVDLVTNGEAYFMDGTKLTITDFGEWLSTVKFISNHIDGPATAEQNVGINVFKVYMGIDPSKV